jgi:hypothetical protein
MIHALRTFPSRFVSLADANETLAAQRDHALIPAARSIDSSSNWRAAGILLISRAAATPTLIE